MGKKSGWIGAAALAALFLGCGERAAEHRRTASTLIIGWPAELGKPERPLAEFDHARHAKALAAEGCAACHVRSEKSGKLWPALKAKIDCTEKGSCTDGWHALCAGCHLQRAAEKKTAGPADCGECHRQLPPEAPPRAEMAFDYPLHQRHVEAVQGFGGAGPRGCSVCHHAEKTGQETACFDCHRREPGGQDLSWRQAAHVDCLDCHLKRLAENQPSGPVDCSGCHAGERPWRTKKPPSTSRLLRGQDDWLFVQVKDTPDSLVPFNHRAHEERAEFCTACHHQALKPCASCHDVEGRGDGSGGVSMLQAFHHPESRLSCVGCHRGQLRERDCAGCHSQLTPAQAGGCTGCHGRVFSAKEALPTEDLLATPAAFELPRASRREFPQELLLDSGGEKFRPTEFPHRRVVGGLLARVEKSPRALLARVFHGKAEVFCAGCHHRQPEGSKPIACRSCHGAQGEPLADRPALREAYHRQCLGCHRAMGLGQGCADCHLPEAQKEVQP